MNNTKQKKATKSEKVTITLSPELKQRLSDRAESQYRSISDHLRMLIEQDLEKSKVSDG